MYCTTVEAVYKLQSRHLLPVDLTGLLIERPCCSVHNGNLTQRFRTGTCTALSWSARPNAQPAATGPGREAESACARDPTEGLDLLPGHHQGLHLASPSWHLDCPPSASDQDSIYTRPCFCTLQSCRLPLEMSLGLLHDLAAIHMIR